MNKPQGCECISSSFRDPSGFLFRQNGIIYRQINTIYKNNYTRFIDSGLYKSLVDDRLLIPHEEVSLDCAPSDKAYKVIKPEPIPFISYPYEWCFSQLKNAALITLEIQRRALDRGMSLKDSSAYNIQFKNGKPLFIDTLSFEEFREGLPWVAYKQFCQHFLAPLALMSYIDVRLNQLMRIYVDGVALDLANALLPFRARLSFGLLAHVLFHSKAQKYFTANGRSQPKGKMPRLSFMGLLDSLESAINKMNSKDRHSQWGKYYEDTNYSAEAFQHKRQVVSDFLAKINPKIVWDLGANTGVFSRIASDKGVYAVSFDNDHAAIEKSYARCVKEKEANILPLLLDLINPSPGIGWDNYERMSLFERGPADAVFALALIHHLAISNNIPLNKIVHFFKNICASLIIEFIPKSDSQAQRLLSSREDIFPDYTREVFEHEFKSSFIIKESVRLKDSQRILYLMERI